MENDGFIVIEGIHENPNNINTLDEQTKIVHGPYNKIEAEKVAKGLIQKNVEINNICEECKKKDESVKQNFIMYSFKVCNSCNLAKTIFPL